MLGLRQEAAAMSLAAAAASSPVAGRAGFDIEKITGAFEPHRGRQDAWKGMDRSR